MSILRFLEREHSYVIVSGTPCGESALSTEQMWKPRKHGQQAWMKDARLQIPWVVKNILIIR